jgi:hypothetical protein
MGEIIDSGLGTKLNQARRLDSVMFRSDPSDVCTGAKNEGSPSRSSMHALATSCPRTSPTAQRPKRAPQQP